MQIDNKNIVVYGGSKKSTVALYHGNVLDLKALSVDPILSIRRK
ncbi:hypothetical protein VPJ63_10945 [Mammaliicoccus lentus]